MNIHNPRTWLALFSGSAVFVLALSDAGKVSPGPLATVHERIPELADRDGCVLCHGEGTVSMADSCLECHDAIDEHLDSGVGVHGGLGRAIVEGCALCHSDHHGTEFELVNARSFALAGTPNRDEFDHQLIGFAMGGKHLELKCTECHENADVDVLADGAFRFIGLDQNCVACHEDPHEGEMSRSCAECHGQETFQDFESFVHDDRFPLFGSHENVSCLDCHETGLDHSVERLDSADEQSPVRECTACHESPHASGFLRRVARLVDFSAKEDCTTCHEVEHEGFRDVGLEITPELHACSGFALAAPHEDVACDDCHSPDAKTFEERYPGRAPEDCAQCHEDPHEGQFEDGPFDNGCLSCHDRLSFEPHEFTAKKHSRTRLPLTGGHADQECNACHEEPEAGLALIFGDAEHKCETCHEDGHAGFFTPFALGLKPHESGECARCHTVESFTQVPSVGFDHEFWTGFQITGSHAQNACESCHPRSLAADSTGRTFGKATEHFGNITGCASCHLDPHEGQFDGPQAPRLVEGRESCARCHVESSFRALDYGFDHELWTGFLLDGTHADISCSECHTPLAADRTNGRTFERALGTNCADCHGFPHAGQFNIAGTTDCTRCHESSASGFDDLLFDHDTDSRFPLEDAHRLLDCTECHRPWRLGEGATVVRYRPLGMDCADCHGSSEGGKGRKRRRNR